MWAFFFVADIFQLNMKTTSFARVTQSITHISASFIF